MGQGSVLESKVLPKMVALHVEMPASREHQYLEVEMALSSGPGSFIPPPASGLQRNTFQHEEHQIKRSGLRRIDMCFGRTFTAKQLKECCL